MSRKNEEQKNKSQTGSESRQGTPEKDVKEGAKSQAGKRNARKGLDGSLKQFRRFKQKRVRKQTKRKRTLGKGALLWKKKLQRKRPVNNRSKAKEVSAVIGSSALEKEGTASDSMKTGTAKRLVDDGKQLLSGEHRDGQQGEAPEQYAVESIQGKGKKVGEVILQEAARAVKGEMTSRAKSSESASEQGSAPPHQKARDAEAPAKSEKTETADAADGSHRKPGQPPKEDAAERTVSEPPSPRGFPTPQNVGTAQPVAVRSSEDKLQALDNVPGEDERGISVVRNRLHASGNPDSRSSDEGGVLGDRYVARGGTSTSPRRQAFGDGDEFLPDPGTYPEPSVTAYDFHSDRELPHRTRGGSGMEELPQPERTKKAGGKVSERETAAELRGPAQSRSARESSRNPVREKGPDGVQTRSVDTSVQLGGRARLQTWQSSPISASLNNQVPALASAQGGAAVQAFANQAVMAQAGGGAMAGAAAGAVSGGMSFAVQAGVQAVQKLIDQWKEAVRNAAASARSSAKAWGTGTALLVLPMIFMLSVVCLFRMGGGATNVGLPENVIALMPQIREACQRHGIPEYVPLAAAVMMRESGGNVDLVHGDVMQCAEGMGYPVGTPVPVEESIDFGTSLLADLLQQAGAQGPADLSRISLALQSYNFGGGYLTWALSHYGGYSKENAREFSDMQAAAMGWSGYGDPLYVDHVLRYRGDVFLRLGPRHLQEKGRRRNVRGERHRAARPPKGDSIADRPQEIAARKTFGHWEMDSVIGSQKSKKTLLVLIERLTRMCLIRLLPDHTMGSVVKAVNQLERKYGGRFYEVFRSITVDNGSEFQDFQGMETARRRKGRRTRVYYCHPYTPSERGSNENLNRLVGRFFPKGSDFDKLDAKAVEKAQDWINTYPRRLLGWHSAKDLFDKCVAMLNAE